MSQPTQRTALVVGAAGSFGHAAARALLAHGWRVRGLSRRPEAARQADPDVDWTRGDAMNPDEVIAAARGAEVLVHAAHPPAYRSWPRLVPAMLESSIAAARAAGARLVLPGTVYNFDPDDGPVVFEDTPQRARTPKGRIRIAMEARLQAASQEGLRVLILRGGDFFGPPPANSWLTGGMVRGSGPLREVTYPGAPDVGHAWAFLPDMAETLARLLDQEARLGAFERFNFAGHWLERGVEMAEAVRRAAGRPDLPIRPFPWLAVRALAPVNETFRGLVETRWLWRRPLRLDNTRLVAFLGEEPHTPLDEAVRASIEGVAGLAGAGAAGVLAAAA